MLIVEQKIRDFTEEQLETAYSEFRQFKASGVIGKSLIRNLYNEHKSEIGSGVGYWVGIELMVMNEVARRYYARYYIMRVEEDIENDPDSGYVSLDRYKELEDKYHCLRLKVG